MMTTLILRKGKDVQGVMRRITWPEAHGVLAGMGVPMSKPRQSTSVRLGDGYTIQVVVQ